MNPTTLRSHTSRQVLAWAALACLAALNDARAHAFIEHTNPVVGSTIKQAPGEVRLAYTQGLEPAFSRVQVFDAAGKEVDNKNGHLDPQNNHVIIVSLSRLDAGKYKVVWRVVSVDTHPTEGSFTFVVAP